MEAQTASVMDFCWLQVLILLFFLVSSETAGSLSFSQQFLGGNNKLRSLFDSSNHLHCSLTSRHPEQPARIKACVKSLLESEATGAHVELIDVATERSSSSESGNKDNEAEESWWGDETRHQPFSPSELEEARIVLLKIHTPELVTGLETTCRDVRQGRIDKGMNPLGLVENIDNDTYVTTESFGVCLRATATWMRCINWIHHSNTPVAMALTRPPGHHATTAQSNGFCIFNFAASAAIHYQSLRLNAKVAILDWDVHFGQGVADIVAPLPFIRYASIHQVPAFPYLGTKNQVQHGNILTVPMTAETTWTCGYRDYYQQALDFLFAGQDDGWQPDLVIVCAGYDALDSDEMASVSLNAQDYGRMTQALLEKMKTSPKSPGLLLGLEGGYQLRPMAGGGNLQQAVVETVKAVLDG